MSVNRFSLDTNILIYSIDSDSKTRRHIAIKLIEEMIYSDCILTTQALSEFYSAATRKNKMPKTDAREQINDWMTIFPVVSADANSLKKAMIAVEEHKLSFWDSLLLETSVQAGVTRFYSEDMQHGRFWKGMEIINPFLSTR